MILLILAAIGGGILTAALVAPFGFVAAVLAAPFGGGVFAMLAALLIVRQRSSKWHSPVDLDEQADVMVATLSSLSAQAKRQSEGTNRKSSEVRSTWAA